MGNETTFKCTVLIGCIALNQIANHQYINSKGNNLSELLLTLLLSLHYLRVYGITDSYFKFQHISGKGYIVIRKTEWMCSTDWWVFPSCSKHGQLTRSLELIRKFMFCSQSTSLLCACEAVYVSTSQVMFMTK